MAGGGAPVAMQVVDNGKTYTKRQEYFAFGLVTSLFFLWGFAYGLLDVLNKHFQTVFGITKLQSTLLQVAYFGAYLVWSFPAGQIMSKVGYKKGIYMGLTLYSTGAVLFWPCAKFLSYGGFVACTFVIGCGLASLEVAANSYIAVIGDPKYASFRLNFSQSFNGVAGFTGPLIASKYFFSDGNETSLTNVQYVYLAVAALGVAVMILFAFATLPEITESQLEAELVAAGTADDKPLWKRPRAVFGFVAQFCYVGAQVTVASFVLNYVTEMPNPFTSAEGSQLFSYMQITFMVGRFASTPLLRFFNPAHMITLYASMCSLFVVVVALTNNRAGLGCLYVVFFFESILYPTIFCVGTSGLGKYTKRGSSLIVMGVGGGAAFPPLQGVMADSISTHISYFIPFIGFVVTAMYGVGMTIQYRIEAQRERNLESNFVEATPAEEKEAYKFEESRRA